MTGNEYMVLMERVGGHVFTVEGGVQAISLFHCHLVLSCFCFSVFGLVSCITGSLSFNSFYFSGNQKLNVQMKA